MKSQKQEKMKMSKEEIINEILEKEKEVKEELEIISFMNMDIGKDEKLVRLRRHLRKVIEKVIKLSKIGNIK